MNEYIKYFWNFFSNWFWVYKLQIPKLCRVTWYIFAPKKTKKKVFLKKINPNKYKIKITKGIIIKLIFFSFIYSKLTLSTKKGHVAPKWVSASSKIVIMINCVSNSGKEYKKKYILLEIKLETLQIKFLF